MMAQTLAERHMKKVRGLLGMVPGSTTPATGSGVGRPASQLSIRKETPQGSGSGTPIKTSVNVLRPQQIARNSSMNTSQKAAPRSQSPILPRQRPPSEVQETTAGISKDDNDPNVRSPSPARSSSSSSSSSSDSPVESRIIKRPPRYKSTFDKDNGEDEDSEPAFLPYRGTGASAGSSGATTTQDLGATLRGDPKTSRRQVPGSSSVVSEAKTETTNQSQTSDSSASSSQVLREQQFRYRQPPGPLSPRRTAELAGRSPRGRVTREGSDGTPSMGSSFSDLDGESSYNTCLLAKRDCGLIAISLDASVTQSALEEALASRMQDGGGTIGSRMSTFGAAIRSRYLPKGNQGGQTQQP